MQVSTKLFNEQSVRQFGKITEDVQNLQAKVSTGKNILRSSDDPVAAVELSAAKEVYQTAFEKSNSGKLQKFEHWLSSKDKSKNKLFLVGDKISSPDFNLFDTLELYHKFLLYYNFLIQNHI